MEEIKEINNVLICGIGAVGSIFAEKIQSFNPNSLRILLDKSRFEKYKKNPTVINGKKINFNYILPQENNFKPDLIIIATKFDGLNDAITNIENFITNDTIMLSLLNGVTSEKIIEKKYGRNKLIYSYFIGHSAVRTGRNITHDDVNTIVFGAENKNDIGKVQKIQNYFNKLNIKYNISNDIIRALWLKYMLNVSANQTSAILKMNFGEMISNEKCMDFAKNIMKEVQAIARAQGVKNTETMIDETINNIKTMMTPTGRTSMLQDIEAGRKTEVQMFAGTIIDFGIKHNIKTPYNKILKEIIEIIQEKY